VPKCVPVEYFSPKAEQLFPLLRFISMKDIGKLVIAVSVFVGVYSMMPSLGVMYDIIFLTFLVANALLIYMVYAVLKYGQDPGVEFDEGYWYSDVDKKYSPDYETGRS